MPCLSLRKRAQWFGAGHLFLVCWKETETRFLISSHLKSTDDDYVSGDKSWPLVLQSFTDLAARQGDSANWSGILLFCSRRPGMGMQHIGHGFLMVLSAASSARRITPISLSTITASTVPGDSTLAMKQNSRQAFEFLCTHWSDRLSFPDIHIGWTCFIYWTAMVSPATLSRTS